MRRLVELWSELELTPGPRLRRAASRHLPRVLLGGGEGYGLFDVRPMAELVQREISWRAVSRVPAKAHAPRADRLVHGGLHRAAPSSSCRRRPISTIPAARRRRARSSAPTASARTTRSRAPRSRFSFLRCGSTDELYLDGGLRQNTPIAPALRLGATHVFAIGSSREVEGASCAKPATTSSARPGGSVPARQGAERVPARPRRRRHRACSRALITSSSTARAPTAPSSSTHSAARRRNATRRSTAT